ncbi:MAG TPA: MarR family winged helix-turn-helix transcriptional regulator [Candidatus Dormibacteraeota bacterium]
MDTLSFERRLDAWMSLLRTQSRLLDLMEADLKRRVGITISRFDVLAQLDRNGGSLRFQRLADAILLSPSGLSRLLDRMQRDGLVARHGHPEDARGQVVSLAPLGRKVLAKAREVHHANVRKWFIDQVGDAEAEVITESLRRVRLALPGGPAAEDAIAWGPAGQTRPGRREVPG